MNTYYYQSTTKLVTEALLDLYNDIKVVVYDTSANNVKDFYVPLKFGASSKAYSKRLESESGKRYYLQDTEMGMTFNGWTYDFYRERSSTMFKIVDNPEEQDIINAFFTYLNPIPILYKFTLSIRTFKYDFLSQIIEQILPYFRPQLSLRVKEFPFLNLETDLVVTCGNDFEVITDEQLENGERRLFTVDINIDVQGYMYRPISNDSIIKVINSKYYISELDIVERYSTSAFDTIQSIPYYTSGYDISTGVFWYKNRE